MLLAMTIVYMFRFMLTFSGAFRRGPRRPTATPTAVNRNAGSCQIWNWSFFFKFSFCFVLFYWSGLSLAMKSFLFTFYRVEIRDSCLFYLVFPSFSFKNEKCCFVQLFVQSCRGDVTATWFMFIHRYLFKNIILPDDFCPLLLKQQLINSTFIGGNPCTAQKNIMQNKDTYFLDNNFYFE